ncbi:neuropeptide ff receptor 2 [Plakobranchus ocellatus]|uniref:Neuropeptide ff receptor 2 n=1 Tax=Plakobranchus ocellatus TaxID=259542 RepID=A0AAV4DZS2_9GAST|nr:neuropeptide ff receptor 2 [Plakobranchus ocellatus]
MKSIKFFLTVFGFFFCSLTPMAVVMAVDNYVDVYSGLYRFVHLIAILNSATNFIIYGVMNKQFRHAFLKTSALARCGTYFCRQAGGSVGVAGKAGTSMHQSFNATSFAVG